MQRVARKESRGHEEHVKDVEEGIGNEVKLLKREAAAAVAAANDDDDCYHHHHPHHHHH